MACGSAAGKVTRAEAELSRAAAVMNRALEAQR